MKKSFVLGKPITIEDAVALGNKDSQIVISPEYKDKIKASAEIVKEIVEAGKPVYGINTGFGELAKVSIPKEDLELLQKNLILSHACSSGKELSKKEAKTMVALRIQTIAQGNSGIRLKTINRFVELFNKNIIPKIPKKGSVGASGDLGTLAQIAAGYLYGEGELWDPKKGEYRDASKVLKDHGYEKYDLAAKEGLALINGTQQISAVGVHALRRGEKQYKASIVVGALSLVAYQGHRDAFSDLIQEIRPHENQHLVGKVMWNLTDTGRGNKPIEEFQGRPQDEYSFRCIPQICGPVLDKLQSARKTLAVEINSSTDNPVVDVKNRRIVSGGNFHGQYPADACDSITIAAKHLLNLTAVRSEKLLIGKRDLPTYLTENPGLNNGFMVPEINTKSLNIAVMPFSTTSQSTGLGTEDHVSMGPHAAQQARKLTKNAVHSTAIEAAAAVQAIRLRIKKDPEFIVPEKLKPIFDALDKAFPHLGDDRYMANDLNKIGKMIRNSDLFENLYDQEAAKATKQIAAKAGVRKVH